MPEEAPHWLVLEEDEEILTVERPSMVPHLYSMAGGVVAGLLALLLLFVDLWNLNLRLIISGVILLGALFTIGREYLSWYSREYAVTTHEVYEKNGLVSGRYAFIPLEYTAIDVDDIVNTFVEQGFLARYYDYGTIVLSTRNDNEVTLRHIKDPQGKRDLILGGEI